MKIAALSTSQIKQSLKNLPDWKKKGNQISREFKFKDYYQTMAFVNALAWVSHQSNHHPDLAVGYNKCTVAYSTHDVGGLSKMDFNCAAKADALIPL